MEFEADMYEDFDDEDLMQYLEEEELTPELAQLLEAYNQGYGDQEYTRSSLLELYQNCVTPTTTQALQNVGSLLGLSLAFRIVCLFGTVGVQDTGVPPWFLHVSSTVFGVMALHTFFRTDLLYMVACCGLAYIVLALTSVRWRHLCGISVSCFIAFYLILCELILIKATTWHMIRGAQMILSMKIISLAFDLGNGSVKNLPNIFEYLGYTFNVGTVIFGPWISYREYTTVLRQNERPVSFSWILKIVTSGLSSILCLIHSTCFTQWLILDDAYKWLRAYRDAQSFRFSHYFVSFLSETTATLSGLGASEEADGIKWDISVAKPHHIEAPRSLVAVVTNWNLPMHYWLKTYVFKSTRPLGNFAAVLLTYAASSLLHGLNFQLAAVLLSLGFYSYAEYVLRNKLSTIYSACIESRRCREDCGHRYGYWNPCVLLTNFSFGLLSVFHLAYLGLMFDSSSQEEQGYTMSHTLEKWAALDYASHWTALATYIFYFMI